MYTTDMYEGLIAETVMMTGANGYLINAYFARPLGAGPFPAMVLAHHMPGWDQWYREITFKFALQGYVTITPNLYFRNGHGTPEDVAAKIRADGGIRTTRLLATWKARCTTCVRCRMSTAKSASSAHAQVDDMHIWPPAESRASMPS